MARNFGTAINLNQNELQNAVVQVLAAAPGTPAAGQIYYDSTLTALGYYDGTNWNYSQPDEVIENAGALAGAAPTGAQFGIDTTTGNLYYVSAGNWTAVPGGADTNIGANDLALTAARTLTMGGFGLTFNGTGNVVIADSGAVTAVSQNLTADTNQIVLDSDGTNSTTLTNGTITANRTLTFPDETGTLATQAYVDALVDPTLKVPEAYDPTGTSAFPTTYGGNAIQAGDSFRITAAGTMASGASVVGPEDLVIALVDSATDSAADWQIAESNREQATETLSGIAEIATAAEATTGTDDLRIMTPLKVQNALDARTFVQTTVAAGSGTPVNVTHNLNVSSPHVTTINEADNEVWTLDVAIVNANTVSITNNGASANFTVRVSY